jgi:hypothetical protein
LDWGVEGITHAPNFNLQRFGSRENHRGARSAHDLTPTFVALMDPLAGWLSALVKDGLAEGWTEARL